MKMATLGRLPRNGHFTVFYFSGASGNQVDNSLTRNGVSIDFDADG